MLVRRRSLWKNGRHAAFPLHHATVPVFSGLPRMLLLPLAAAAERQELLATE